MVEIFERIMRDRGRGRSIITCLIDYLCRVTGGTLCAGDDVARAEWVHRGAVCREYTITEGTLPVIEKAFQQR